jgi:hypothetical protein
MSTILPGSTSSEFAGIGGIGSIGIDLNSIAGGGIVRPLQSHQEAQQNLAQNQQQQSRDGEAQNGSHTFSGILTPGTFLSPRVLPP